jgi:hypothetical protein
MSDFVLLARLRRSRHLGVAVFVALILLVGLERWLAEMHHNLRSAGEGLENVDSLDGDEIRGRLIILNDDRPPALPTDAGAVVGIAVLGAVDPPYFALVGQSTPRAPPGPHSSSA